MEKWSKQSKSFVILFSIAIIGSLINLLLLQGLLSRNLEDETKQNGGEYQIIDHSKNQLIKPAEAAEPPVDITDWLTYSNEEFGFSFKYMPGWKVKSPVTKEGWKIIGIDPGRKYYNINIYVSDTGFFAMDSLPQKQETINGKTAVNVSDMLYGIQSGSYYFTFDMGYSVSLKPFFKAMLQTVSFK